MREDTVLLLFFAAAFLRGAVFLAALLAGAFFAMALRFAGAFFTAAFFAGAFFALVAARLTAGFFLAVAIASLSELFSHNCATKITTKQKRYNHTKRVKNTYKTAGNVTDANSTATQCGKTNQNNRK
tara:strand:+ start:144836 stop:145216 length:381 start_codon:yes stop_codon:yes gene_type:complete